MMLSSNRIPVAILTLGLLAACKGDDDTGPEYFAPTADAGENQVVALGQTVNLDGSESLFHFQFDELSHTWAFEQIPVESQLDHTAFGTANGSSAAELVTFLPDVVGTYVVSLTVFDGLTMSQPDLAVIEVASENMPPIADCGDDQFGEVGERVHFNGTASRDPEGTEITYVWTLASAPECSELDSTDIYDSQTAEPSLVADCAGTYVLSLIVSDDLEYSEPCYVSVIIASENLAPIADAGVSEVLAPCAAEFELNGNGSYDPDGDEITYAWEVVSVPPGSAVTTEDNLSDPTDPESLFTWDLVGEYTLSLQVFDGELYSARDLVTLVLQSPTANHAPSANAGDDQTIEAESECTTQDYVFDCDPCAAQKFELDGTASSDADGDVLAYQWTDTNNEITYGGQYLAWTEAYTPPAEADYGTANTNTYEVTLTVADCEDIATDTVTLTVLCTGDLP